VPPAKPAPPIRSERAPTERILHRLFTIHYLAVPPVIVLKRPCVRNAVCSSLCINATSPRIGTLQATPSPSCVNLFFYDTESTTLWSCCIAYVELLLRPSYPALSYPTPIPGPTCIVVERAYHTFYVSMIIVDTVPERRYYRQL
jgi:hypothetical protein